MHASSIIFAVIAATLVVSVVDATSLHPLAKATGLRGVESSYSESTARANVYAAAVAYCDESAIMDWSCSACQQLSGLTPIQYAYDEELNVAAYVASVSGAALVSFRGTVPSSLKDWIDDLDASKMAGYAGCDGCEVHSGFFDSYQALRSQILDGINAIHSVSSVVVTGHSLGAAMAALCAYDLAQSGYSVEIVYTFGQPRVGNAAFAAAFAESVSEFRLVHWRDIVPHLPTEFMGFHHVPTEVWYQEDNTQYQVCDGSGEDPDCSDSLTITTSISDHLSYLNIPISNSC